MGSKTSWIFLLLVIVLLTMPCVTWADNIDPANDGSKYAYGENIGWINFQPSQGPGVTVSSAGLSGYVWGENVGWINLNPSAGGVLNDGFGNLSGYAWGENIGWINFAPTSGGVFIDECGDFNGYAWGENIGWINFRSENSVPFKVSTSWIPPDVFPPTTSALGPGSGWYNTNVSVSLQAADNVCGSGVKDIRYSLGGGPLVTIPGATASLTITAEGYNILSYLSTDNANNAEASHLMTVKIDRTPPSIMLAIPADTAKYFINSSVVADYGATDSLSGIAGIIGSVPSGDPINTGSIGTKSFTVTAIDAAGNSAAVTASYFVAFPGNIDTDNAGCQYAWAENVGWINFKPSWGPGVTVSNTAVTGKAWGDNIGWINLSPANGGVVNNGQGNLSGYAWGENVGWINFGPVGGGVRIGSDGRFAGYAWGENIGWINFSSLGSCVKTTWTVPNNPPVVVAPITAPLDPVAVGLTVAASAPFSDAGILDTHTATWDWGDGTTSPGIVTENNGSGSVNGTHVYLLPGVYTITVTVMDDYGGIGTAVFEFVVVYDPAGGFVTGGGWITSPLGAYTPDPSLTGKATFGFVSKYKKGATVPTGETEFQFKVANLDFHSEIYEWLVVAGARAQYKGNGTINDEGSYGFMLTAIDGALPGGGGNDKFRIKIWDKATDQVVYDNMLGAADDADPSTAIGGGSIVIHK